MKKLTPKEIEFMNIVWDKEPVASKEIIQSCEEVFGWNKSTTYTFLKRLENKGVLVNEHSLVRSLIKKEQVQKEESSSIIRSAFDGSLSNFVVAFLSEEKLTKKEYEELERIISSYKEKA